jgi:hypothetical protein
MTKKKETKNTKSIMNINCKTKVQFKRTLQMGELLLELLNRSKLPVVNFRINGVYFGKRHIKNMKTSKKVQKLIEQHNDSVTELALGVS